MTWKYLEYLVIILHSKLISFAFKTFYAGGWLWESWYRYKKAFLEILPILVPNDELANNKLTDEDICKLYDLSDEEIKLISSSINQ
jgi:hypothetical protein